MYVCSGVLMEATVRFLPFFYLTFGTEPHAHPLPVTRVTGACCHAGLSMGVGNLNSVIHICASGHYQLSHLPDLHTDKFVKYR